MKRRLVGSTLLALAAVLAVCGVLLWWNASRDADNAERTITEVGAALGAPDARTVPDVQPDYGLAQAAFGLAALVVLSGVIVLSTGPLSDGSHPGQGPA